MAAKIQNIIFKKALFQSCTLKVALYFECHGIQKKSFVHIIARCVRNLNAITIKQLN
jgi:hypothetical protein